MIIFIVLLFKMIVNKKDSYFYLVIEIKLLLKKF